MKKQMIILFVLLTFISCTKNNNDPDRVAVNTGILTSGVWHFSYYSYYGGIPTVHITYADLPACRQDDLRQFNTGGTGETNEGPTKCNSSDPQSQPVQWRFLNNYATSIELNGDEYYIDKLDAHEFKFHKKHSDPYAPEYSYGYSR